MYGGGSHGIEFRLLGSVEVAAGNRVIEIGSLKQRALLVALLLRLNHPVPADTLVEDLWGDCPAPQRRPEPPEPRLPAQAGSRNRRPSPATGRATLSAAATAATSSKPTPTPSTPAGSSASWPPGGTRSPAASADAAVEALEARAGAVAGPGARRTFRPALRPAGGRPPRRGADDRRRGAGRGVPRSRPSRGRPRPAHHPRRPASPPGTGLGAADAGAVPARPPGRRPACVPAGAPHPGRGTGGRPHPRAAEPRGADPAAVTRPRRARSPAGSGVTPAAQRRHRRFPLHRHRSQHPPLGRRPGGDGRATSPATTASSSTRSKRPEGMSSPTPATASASPSPPCRDALDAAVAAQRALLDAKWADTESSPGPHGRARRGGRAPGRATGSARR